MTELEDAASVKWENWWKMRVASNSGCRPRGNVDKGMDKNVIPLNDTIKQNQEEYSEKTFLNGQMLEKFSRAPN